MRFGERALGLHLRAGAWRAVHVESRLTRKRILGAAGGRFEDASDLPRSVAAALEEAFRALAVGPETKLGVALARPLAHLKQVTLRPASRAEVARSIQAQAASLFPIGRGAVVADFHRARWNGAARRGATDSAVVAVAPEELVEAVAASARALGLRLETVDVGPGALTDWLPPNVDALLVCEDDVVEWVELGPDRSITRWRDLPLRCDGVPAAQEGAAADADERLAANEASDAVAGWLSERRALAVAPRGWLEALCEPPDGRETAVARLVLPPKFAGSGIGAEYTVALGAGLQALGASRSFDLRPERMRAAQMRSSRVRTATLGAIALATVSLYALSGFVVLRSDVRALAREAEAVRPRAETAAELQRSVQRALENAATLAQLDAGRPHWTRVLGALTAALPKEAYLTELSASGGKFRIEGFAASASAVVAALERTEHLSRVRLAGPVARESTPEGEREGFAIEAEWSAASPP